MMEKITHNDLPEAVYQIALQVQELKRLLLAQSNEPSTEPDRWFNLIELCEYLPDKPAKPTVYGWVHTGIIPCHKGAKRLRFLKSEIDAWLKEGRKMTVAETAREADRYIMKNKKGLKHGA